MRKKLLTSFSLFLLLFSLGIGVWVFRSLTQTKSGSPDLYVPAEGGSGPDIEGDALFVWDILLSLGMDISSTYGEEQLEQLATQTSVLGYEANIILAGRRASQGGDTAPYFRRALELYNDTDIRWRFASWLHGAGRLEEAVAEYLKLLPDEEALEALVDLAAGPEAIARVLTAARHWWQAAEFLEPLFEADAGSDTALAKLYATSLGEAAEYKKLLSFLQPLIGQAEPDPTLSWWYARSLEAAGQVKKAAQIYSSLGQSGAYRLGLLLEKEGKATQAAEAFSQSTLALSRWRGARLFDEQGKRDQALEIYLALAREPGSYQDDAAYRAYILLARSGPVAEEMHAVLAGHPAWMKRLGNEPAWQIEEDYAAELPDFLQRVDAFRAAGLDYPAGIELAIGINKAQAAEKLALGEWYLAQGQYFQAVRWGSSALRELPVRKAYELAYPRPFLDDVLLEAANYNLDPYLVLAVIREESHFRPDAVSRVGALGLMQIMPATGRGIASGLKVQFSEKDLLTPEINIRFGAYYLRNMLNMFKGDLDKALAAYNGGGGNVQRWSASKTGGTAAGFPTAVAFFETREYITKVKNSYYTYLWLYGD
ncbi:MAG: lytic transglycosylase domain-containing protein [Dethiobacter sp.]|jgi:soluble lytic murein transglycosylase|nr:lytic transglycosylase domain-containing protein [Dethiobacter sp.]